MISGAGDVPTRCTPLKACIIIGTETFALYLSLARKPAILCLTRNKPSEKTAAFWSLNSVSSILDRVMTSTPRRMARLPYPTTP